MVSYVISVHVNHGYIISVVDNQLFFCHYYYLSAVNTGTSTSQQLHNVSETH